MKPYKHINFRISAELHSRLKHFVDIQWPHVSMNTIIHNALENHLDEHENNASKGDKQRKSESCFQHHDS